MDKNKKIWKEMTNLTDSLVTLAKSIGKQDEIINTILEISQKQTEIIKQNKERIEELEEALTKNKIKFPKKIKKKKQEFYVA